MMILLIVVCWLIDMTSYFTLDIPQLALTSCCFYSLAFVSKTYRGLMLAGLCMLLQSFLATGLFGLDLVIMIPLLGLIRVLRALIDIPWPFKGFLAFGAVALHGYLITGGLSLPVFHCIVCLIMVYLLVR